MVETPRERPIVTEFPVKSFDRDYFITVIQAWLGGVSKSKLPQLSDADIGKLVSSQSTGESFLLQEFESEDGSAIGFLYDRPDKGARVRWVTECVLSKTPDTREQYLLRLRTSAEGEADNPPAPPRLIKLLLEGEKGGSDGELEVSDKPVWLTDSQEDIAKARAIIDGNATVSLPVIYVSASGNEKWDLGNKKKIEDFASRMGGFVHVVVEPNEDFAYELSALCDRRNPYGGTVGFMWPQSDRVKKHYIDGEHTRNSASLISNLRGSAFGCLRQMSFAGWDWFQLQKEATQTPSLEVAPAPPDPLDSLTGEPFVNDSEGFQPSSDPEEEVKELTKRHEGEIEKLKDENEKLTKRHEDAEGLIKLYEDENEKLKGENEDLKKYLRQKSDDEKSWYERLADDAKLEEFYPGEISDRLRYSVSLAMKDKDLDKRSKNVLKDFLKNVEQTRELTQFLKKLGDINEFDNNLERFLKRYGFSKKSENKHIRLESAHEGIDNITLPKTPSDRRAILEHKSDLKKILGIDKLDKIK